MHLKNKVKRGLLTPPAAESGFLGWVKNEWTEAQQQGLCYRFVYMAVPCQVFKGMSILLAPQVE